jgi:DNA-directed RNA polymerase omega subunit
MTGNSPLFPGQVSYGLAPSLEAAMGLVRTHYAEAIAKVGGYYNFVTLINRRLKELRNGEGPMLQPGEKEDEIDLVVREIEAGLLTLDVPAVETA